MSDKISSLLLDNMLPLDDSAKLQLMFDLTCVFVMAVRV